MLNKSRAYTRENDDVLVFDLDFAAFCHINYLPLKDSIEIYRQNFRTKNRIKEFVFIFVDPTNKIKDLAILYANSESARHADAVRRLKKTTRIEPFGS